VTWKTTVVNTQPIALGFRAGGTLLLAGASGVQTADQRRVAAFKESATAADFAVAGDRVAYLGATGLHLVDLTSGKDTPVGSARAWGGGGPDGHPYAYVTDPGVNVADASDGPPAKPVALAGVSGLSGPRGQQLLLSAPGGLFRVDYTGSGPATARSLSAA